MVARRVALAVVALAVAGLVGVGISVFGGLVPLADEELAGVGFVVKDGYVGIGVVDVGGGRLALVDAGNDPDAEALALAVGARGRDLEDVAAVFLTHGHRDHVAAIPRLAHARVYAMEPEAPFLAGEVAYRGPVVRLFGPGDPVRVTDLVRDGAAVTVGDRTFEGFHLPGHTAGSAAWLVDGVLFLGDNATIDAEGRLRPAPWVFSDDTAQNRASLRALAERVEGRDVRRLVPSHSGSHAGAAPLLAFPG
ncbi:MAG: MBL fold metallo-hydrolase [Myxococcota bacterium]